MGQGQKAAAAWSSRSVACGAMARTMAMCGSPGRLTGEVERDGGDDDLRQRPERPPEPRRGPVVEDAVPPVPDYELREDHGQRQVGPQAVQ